MAALVLAVSSAAWAGTSSAGVINEWAVNGAGNVAFNTTGTRANMPPCATLADWAFTGAEPGSVLASTLISSMLASRAVLIYGTGSCDANGRETVAYVSVVF